MARFLTFLLACAVFMVLGPFLSQETEESD